MYVNWHSHILKKIIKTGLSQVWTFEVVSFIPPLLRNNMDPYVNQEQV